MRMKANRQSHQQARLLSFLQISHPRQAKFALWARFGGIVDIERCPLYPQKRTLKLSNEMSALCQKQTFTASLDHLVGGDKKCLRHCEAERLGGLEVNHQVELDRLLDWQVSRPRAVQNPIHVGGRASEQVR